jgi:hypothetical protein
VRLAVTATGAKTRNGEYLQGQLRSKVISHRYAIELRERFPDFRSDRKLDEMSIVEISHHSNS